MIKTFQLRAARSVSGSGVREIGSYLKVSRTTISEWQQQHVHFVIRSNVTNPDALIFFFKQYNVDLSDSCSVKYITNTKACKNSTEYFSRFQLRASRNALGLTQEALGQLINIPRNIINSLETNNNTQLLNNLKSNIDYSVVKHLFDFFTDQGIVYPDQFTITIQE